MQIPIIESLIEAYISSGQYHEADKRQSYLYRIRKINYRNDEQRTLKALLNFAEWQRQAYLLNIDKSSGKRLLITHDIYQQAIQMIMTSSDQDLTNIIAPLEGLMSVQYLLSIYQGNDPETFQFSSQSSSDGFSDPVDNRLRFLQASAFRQGKITLDRLRHYRENDKDTSILALVEHNLAMADWHLWYNKRSAAMKLYYDTYQKLLKLEDADFHIDRFLGSPVSLPTIGNTSLEFLEKKIYTENKQGHFLVSYKVNKSGQTFQFELIQAIPEAKSRIRSKIIRELKSKRFRPKFENGKPVVTKDIVEEYVY